MPSDPVIVGEIGSHAHGLATRHSDHDYHGIVIEPPEQVIGVVGRVDALRIRDKPEGVKSEAGDHETTLYGLHKFVKLCLSGNPTMLTLLFTPTLTVPDTIGLQAHRHLFLNRQLAERHVGYSESMRRQLVGDKAPRTNRPDLVAKHGYDTKAAFHALRLLMQGTELLLTGGMLMPMLDGDRDCLMAVRNGWISIAEVLEQIEFHRWLLETSVHVSPLPAEPDYQGASNYLVRVYYEHWGV